MKDKITVILVCSFFIGMVWISSTSNTTSSNNPVIVEEIISIPIEDTTMEFIDNGASENFRINETELQTEISAINTCDLKAISTDVLTFNEAFGYYRNCLGNNGRFQWKGIEYTTLLSEELIIQAADLVKISGNGEEAEISKIR